MLGNGKIYQHDGIFWRYLMLKFALPPTANLKFVLPPTPTPNASQWNLGGVGSSGVGYIYFMYIPRWLCENYPTQRQIPVEYRL